MKKVILILTALSVFLAFTYLDAAPQKYDDIKNILDKMGKSMEEFNNRMEKASNAKEVADALNQFTADQRAALPDFINLLKKYPNLEELIKTNVPEELKPYISKMNEIANKMAGVLGKIKQFQNDPGVQKAQEDMTKLNIEMAQLEQKIQKETKKQE